MGAGGPFQQQLRNSLVRRLTESLRGGGSSGVTRLLRVVRDAVRDASPPAALRHFDRAWRAYPGEALTVAPLYAQALMLGGDDAAALSISQLALDLAPDPDVVAVRIMALLHSEHYEESRERLETALADYCVMPGGTLACAADEVVGHPAIDAVGWIGVGPKLDIMSGLARPETKHDLQIHVHDGLRIAHCRGRPLLGSNARTPGDFGMDGRADYRARQLAAWARIGWLATTPPRLRVEDDHRHTVDLVAKGPPPPGWRWHFTLDLSRSGLRGDSLRVDARLPDGRWQPLPDSPLLLKAPLPRAGRSTLRRTALRSTRARSFGPTRRIDLVIPVYGNREETLACIESALNTVGDQARLVVVDDAGEDPLLAAALDGLSRNGRIQLLRNAKNLGFAGAVNRGLARDPSGDVVLLNSDTLVFGDWLSRLRAAAYASPTVGTATPLTNYGTIASYPRGLGNEALAPDDAAALHTLASVTNSGRSVDIPVGVGFCLYLRRDCLNAVGNLDVAVFGKGYGEETDFCLRARRLGWTHRLAADVYVTHAGGLSFGTRRAALLDRSQRLLNLRHPGFDRSIARFLNEDPVLPLRRNLDEQRLRAHAGRHVLIVTLALSGGVDRFVKERCRQLRALGLTPLLLRPSKPGDASGCELSADTETFELPNLRYAIPSELSLLECLLRSLTFEAVEIQHFLGLDARVIEIVRALPVPYEVFVHDYAWLCPRVTLIDGRGRYCGEPAVTVCESCVKRNGSNLGEALSVKALRKRSATWLHAARRVIAPSPDAAARFGRYFRGLDVEVRPHAPAALPVARAPRPHPGTAHRTVRIALLGAIGEHKGYRVLLDCARDARARCLPIEFVVIGYTENDAPLLGTGKVFITGPYIDGEAPHLIAREQPDLAWLPSVWPETWCYTLDYALGAGLPVAAFDLGAIAERLRSTPHAQSLLLPLTMKSQCINDALLDFVHGTPLAARAATNSVKSLPAPRRGMANIDELQLRGMSMIKSSNAKTAAEGLDAGLSASVQVLPLSSGLYLFSVKAAKPITPTAGGQLTLPAMHVGLGPGVHSDQVEFMSSPSTHGAWLFSATDQLVTRINGNGVKLVLTSVRAPTGDVLSIKVERLDSRIETEATTAPLAAAAKPKMAVIAKSADAPLSLQMVTHVRTRGDMQFIDAPWAGRVGPGLWIESFTVLPLEHLDAHDIEYKGLTGSGFETPWLSDNAACGTKGMGVPLVGFAVRLRPSTSAAAYDCEYSGYFQSGLTVGPLRNGAPCRSSVANDPLEGIQVRLVKRPKAATLMPATAAAAARATPKTKVPTLAAVKPGKRVALAR